MQTNFFNDIEIQKVLKQSNKITHSYNNKFGSFLIYPLFKSFTIIYCGQELTTKAKNYLKKIAKKHKAIYTVVETLQEVPRFESKSFKEFIPRATRQISLSQPLKKIYSQMHQKGRYNARLAQKKGLTVSNTLTPEDFYELLIKTSSRDGFSINPLAYYQALFQLPANKLHKYAIYKDQKLIAAAVTLDHDSTTYYLYGASSIKHRNLMAPYLIQFSAITDAHKRKQKTYDFLGVSPYSPHPLDKVSEFKRKFGGQIIHYQNNQIVIHKPILFSLLRIRKLIKYIKSKLNK